MSQASSGRGAVARQWVRAVVPLAVRRPLAVLVGRLPWIEGRYWWTFELLRDFAERDPDGFHRFLWAHHLGYAESYEVDRRFGEANLHPTRRMLFADLAACLQGRGVEPADIMSVFEVGCSLGYLLRHLETGLFSRATVFEGIDIDRHAILEGSQYLRRAGSVVRLHLADMAELDRVMEDRRFDLTFAAGVLMYLQEGPAAAVVRTMFRHTGRIVALAGLAHPTRDNRDIEHSEPRERDGTMIHNLDRMVRDAGGTVLFRRWEGARDVEGNTVYWVFAAPGAA